jgi:hypothetical protein
VRDDGEEWNYSQCSDGNKRRGPSSGTGGFRHLNLLLPAQSALLVQGLSIPTDDGMSKSLFV